MLNKYENNGKKKFIATTLALAITFSSLTSVSYKLSDSLFLSASATTVTQVQEDDAEIKALTNRLYEINEESCELEAVYDFLKKLLVDFDESHKHTEGVKGVIAVQNKEFKKEVQKKYRWTNSYTEASRNDEVHSAASMFRGWTFMSLYDMPQDAIRNACNYIISAIENEDFTNCETFDEVEEITEAIINQAYTIVDNSIEQDYITSHNYAPEFLRLKDSVSSSKVKNILDQIRTSPVENYFEDYFEITASRSEVENLLHQIDTLWEELSKEEDEIRECEKYKRYEEKKALEREYKSLNEEYNSLREQLENVWSRLETVYAKLAEFDNNEN